MSRKTANNPTTTAPIVVGQTELLQVVVRQARQVVQLDTVVGKRLRVLAGPELVEPFTRYFRPSFGFCLSRVWPRSTIGRRSRPSTSNVRVGSGSEV